MSTPLSFCDISARYGQMPAPRKTLEEQTGWNLNRLFMDYLTKVRARRDQDAKEAEEDALMAMIDAMNAPEKDKKAGKTDMANANALMDAGKAIVAQSEEVLEDGTKVVKWVDPTQTLTVQALMACLGDRFTFEQADKVQENTEQAEEEAKEERLKVTEERTPSEPSETDIIERR